MLPMDFEGSNMPMRKPDNMTAEECGDLQVRGVKTKRGPMFTSCWRPSYEDLKLLAKGCSIIIKVHMNDVIFANVSTVLKDDPDFFAFNMVIVWLPSGQQLDLLRSGHGLYITFLTTRFPVMEVYVNEQ